MSRDLHYVIIICFATMCDVTVRATPIIRLIDSVLVIFYVVVYFFRLLVTI